MMKNAKGYAKMFGETLIGIYKDKRHENRDLQTPYSVL